MQKVLVVGCPGSGKSTFARALHDATELPLYYLDMLFWNSDKTTVERDVFLERLNSVLQKPRWIIDGNYASTMEKRIVACDTVFFLDYTTEICLDGLAKRCGIPRPDMPWIEYELDEEFIEFVKNYNTTSRPFVVELLNKYKSKNIIVFHNRKEADEYLKSI